MRLSFLIKTLLLVWLIVLAVASSANAQKHRRSLLLRKDRPSVYIEFVRSGKAPPLFEGEREDRIWLSLSNNTRWGLSFCSFSVDRPYGNVAIVYDLKRSFTLGTTGGEDTMVRTEARSASSDTPLTQVPVPQGYSTGDTCTPYHLTSGKSVVFSVPRAHLGKDLYLEFEFWYDWENRDNVLGSFPQSYVSFSHGELPLAEKRAP